jgi:hypothetical protein
MRFVEKRQGVIILVFILLLLVMIIILLLILAVTECLPGGIFLMDSLNMHSALTVTDNLRGYLRSELAARRKRIAKRAKSSGEPIEGDASIDATADALLSGMPIAQLAVPKQANGFDCGVFALQYAEEMMVRWPECRFQVEGFSDKVFTLNDINISRHHKNI